MAHVAGSYALSFWGNTQARIGTYNQDSISQATYDLMMTDPHVALCADLKRLALMSIEHAVEGPNPRVNAYVDACFSTMKPAVLRYCADQGALRGTLPAELVWEYAPTSITYKVKDENQSTGPAAQDVVVPLNPKVTEMIEGWRLAKFKPLSLLNLVSILEDGMENLAGLRCVTPSVDLPVEECAVFLFSHNLRSSLSSYMSWFGEGELKRVYDAWYRKQVLQDAFMVWMQRMATPPAIVNYPPGSTADGDVATIDTNSAKANDVGKTLRDGAATFVTLPGREIAGEPITSVAQWQVEFAKVPDAHNYYIDAFNWYNSQIAHGLLVTDKMATAEGATGSYSLSQTTLETFLMAIDGLAEEVLSAVNKQLVPNLVANTFGDSEPTPTITTPGLSEKKSKLLLQLIPMMARSGLITVDPEAVEDITGLPIMANTPPSAVVTQQPTNPSAGTAAVDAAEGEARSALVELAENVRKLNRQLL